MLCVKRLLAAGADPNHVSLDEKFTPLFGASARNHPQIVGILLDAGASVDTQDEHRMTALHAASTFGFADVIEVLLGRGADPNEQDDRGWTPLHTACKHGNAAAVEMLIKGGGSVLNRAGGVTPKQLALQEGHTEVVQVFESEGADTDVTISVT